MVVDNVPLIRPRVIMYFQSDIIKRTYFDTFKEAKDFADQFTKGEKWIGN